MRNIRYRLSSWSPVRRKQRAQARRARREDAAWEERRRDARAARAARETERASGWEQEPDAYRSRQEGRGDYSRRLREQDRATGRIPPARAGGTR